MSVSAVNSVSFAGKTKQTKKGNDYNKTKTAKIAGAAVGFLAIPTASVFVAMKGGANLKNSVGGIFAAYFTKNGIWIDRKIAALCLGGLALTTFIGFGLGAGIDAIINKVRRNKADKIANKTETKTEEVAK